MDETITNEIQQDLLLPGADFLEATPESQGLDPKKLAKAVKQIKKISGRDGVDQCLVLRHGYLVWHGPDIDNFHHIWSGTKAFLGLILGLLVDDGKCTLDSRAADFCPDLRQYYPEVTIRQFANFTSGYVQTEHSSFLPDKPLHAPGACFYYSWASDEFANVLTRVAGEPLRDLFKRRIADPIGMRPDRWSWGDWGEVNGLVVCGGSGWMNKGVWITAREMARLATLLLNRGRWNDRQIIPESWVREMFTNQVPRDLPIYQPDKWYYRLPGAYGLGWWINTPTHTGQPNWPAAPADTFASQANRNNFCFIIPPWNMIIVRQGTDIRVNTDLFDTFLALFRDAIVG